MLKVHCNCKKTSRKASDGSQGKKKLRGIVVIPMRLKKPCSSRIWHHHSHAMPKKPTRFQWFILQMWPKVDWQLQPFLHSNPQAKKKKGPRPSLLIQPERKHLTITCIHSHTKKKTYLEQNDTFSDLSRYTIPHAHSNSHLSHQSTTTTISRQW